MSEEQQQQPSAQAGALPSTPGDVEVSPTSEPQVSQVTSQTPATRPAKNPKRVAAGKMVAERTRVACEVQEKAYLEKIAKENEKILPLPLSRLLKPHQSLLQLIPKFQMVSAQTNGSLSLELALRLQRLMSSVNT